MNDVVITVDHVSKNFKLPHEKNTSIKSAVINSYKRRPSFDKQEALKDVSFEVQKGEFFGIVGRNGSGKSTLLKMLAGIYTPTNGSVHVKGKLTPFIELGVGFNPELTGRENVFLNGALLGFSRKEMLVMYDEIVSFAELEKFMDQKLKNYSSGMQVRLAFSIAIRAETDILLIDEVLAVGDAAFQQKCYEIFSEMKKLGRTMVLVTHDMAAVSRFCDRAILINDGVVRDIGKPKDIADAYLELNYDQSTRSNDKKTRDAAESDKSIEVKNAKVSIADGSATNIKPGTNATISFSYVNTNKKPIQFGVQIFNEAGTYCFGANTSIAGVKPVIDASGKTELSITLDLVPGNYNVTAAIMNQDATKVHVYRPNVAKFRIAKTTEVEGVANLTHKWGN